MPAARVAASPWMNPARWANAAPTGGDAGAGPAGWQRDQYTTVLARGPARAAAVERALAAVLAYRIFPPERLVAALPGMRVEPGATIVQGFRLGPIGLIAAVRVVNVFDRERDGVRRAGFSYQTLAGHPARGAMTVAVVDDATADEARLELDVVSRPDGWLARLGAPVARRVQRSLTRAALARVVALANADHPPPAAPT
jgi:uncharacterized protein (UPF0548 family)